jgi:hypothetical protein
MRVIPYYPAPQKKKFKAKTVRRRVETAVKEIAWSKSIDLRGDELSALANQVMDLVEVEHDLARIAEMARISIQIANNKSVPYREIELMKDTVEDFIPVVDESLNKRVNKYIYDEKSRNNMIALLVSTL